MWKFISLMLICCTANAAMYSCADDSGKKVFRSEPCEQNEKQEPVVKKAEPSYYIINGTGEKQGVDSYQEKRVSKYTPSIVAGNTNAKQHPLPEQMQKTLSKAKAFGLKHSGNGGLIIASAYCGLWKSNVNEEHRQALLFDAEAFAVAHPNNGALYVSAALGRCPDPSPPVYIQPAPTIIFR
jgi:hypothetical protein